MYQFDQNNSGGSFVTNDRVCHRVIIQANSYEEAKEKAMDLGIYFNGCADGHDCPCCGDRWYESDDTINMREINKRGCGVSSYKSKEDWHRKYDQFIIVKEPELTNKYGFKDWEGMIKFKNFESYLQFLANEYGWTKPDIRVYYANGKVKEIFTQEGCKR